MSFHTWAQKFGVVDSELQEIKQQLKDGEDPLRWFLLTGKVPEREYLRWAMETYSIPLVQNDFFSIPPDPVFWNAVKDIYSWTPGFIPLAEWQGVLLIGCLEPPQFHFRIPFESRFVLAAPRALEAYWRSLNPEVAATRTAIRPLVPPQPTAVLTPPSAALVEPTTATPPALESAALEFDDPAPAQPEPAEEIPDFIPQPPSFETAAEPLAEELLAAVVSDTKKITLPPLPPPIEQAAPPPAPSQVVQEVRQRPKDEVLADDLPPAPQVNLDIPDGFGLNLTPKDDRLFVVPDGMSLSEAKHAAPEATNSPLRPAAPEAPDGLSGTHSVSLDFGSLNENSKPPSKPKQAVQEATKQTVDTAPSIATSPSLDDTVPLPAKTPSVDEDTFVPEADVVQFASAPAPAPTPAAASENDEPIQASTEKMRGPAQLMDFQTMVGFSLNNIVSDSQSRVPFSECKTLDALADNALIAITETFEHGVMFMFQRGDLRPFKWTSNLLSVKGEKPDPIDLSYPSIFRIVHRTRLPYHGYVVANPVNTQFFNHFHRGEIPKHVTVTPVLIGSGIAGMLMGISNNEIDYRESLKKMEALTVEVANALAPIREQSKSAA